MHKKPKEMAVCARPIPGLRRTLFWPMTSAEKNFHPLEKTAFRLVPLGGQVRQGNRDRPLYTPHQGNQTPYSDREKGKSADEQCCHYKLLDDEIREEYHDVLPDDERGLPLFRFSGDSSG